MALSLTSSSVKLIIYRRCATVCPAGLVTDMEDDECSDQRPLIKTEECTFAYIKHSNLYVVATTRKNSNIAMLFTLLHKICAVMQEYFKEVISHFS